MCGEGMVLRFGSYGWAALSANVLSGYTRICFSDEETIRICTFMCQYDRFYIRMELERGKSQTRKPASYL